MCQIYFIFLYKPHFTTYFYRVIYSDLFACDAVAWLHSPYSVTLVF